MCDIIIIKIDLEIFETDQQINREAKQQTL